MDIQDKVTGRIKQAAGDLLGDEELRNQGVTEERKADAKRELNEAQLEAERKRDEVARLEYETSKQSASRRAQHEDHDLEPAGTEHQTTSGHGPDGAADPAAFDRP